MLMASTITHAFILSFIHSFTHSANINSMLIPLLKSRVIEMNNISSPAPVGGKILQIQLIHSVRGLITLVIR